MLLMQVKHTYPFFDCCWKILTFSAQMSISDDRTLGRMKKLYDIQRYPSASISFSLSCTLFPRLFTYPVNVFLKKQGYLPDRHSNVLLNKNSERSINHYRSNCFLYNITSVRHKSHLLSQTKRIQCMCLTANGY